MGSMAAVAAYVHAMMGVFEPGSAAGLKLSEWLSESGHGVGIDFAGTMKSRRAMLVSNPANCVAS